MSSNGLISHIEHIAPSHKSLKFQAFQLFVVELRVALGILPYNIIEVSDVSVCKKVSEDARRYINVRSTC